MCNINDPSSQRDVYPNAIKTVMEQPERLREFEESEDKKAASEGKPQTNERQGDSCEGLDCM